MTVIDCLNIAGAKAPIAPVLNTPLLCIAFAGFHATVFAYGATGAGKTFTLFFLDISCDFV